MLEFLVEDDHMLVLLDADDHTRVLSVVDNQWIMRLNIFINLSHAGIHNIDSLYIHIRILSYLYCIIS